MASEPPPPPRQPHHFSTSPCCGSSSPPRTALRRSKTVANPESPLRWRREPLVDVTNLVLGRAGREWTPRLQRLPSLEPSLRDDLESDVLGTPTRTVTRILPLRRTRSAIPQPHVEAVNASPSPARASEAIPALAHDGLASPSSPADRDLRLSTRPAVVQQPSTRRSARVIGEGGGGSTAPAPPRRSTPLGRRRTFNGLETLAVVREDVAEAAPSRPTTPLTRSRSEAGIDASGGVSLPNSPQGSEQASRRLRRRRTSDDAALSPSTSLSGSLQTRSSSRKGLR